MVVQDKAQMCISCSSFTEHVANTVQSYICRWLRSELGCFTGVQESEVHNGVAEQGSDVHQLLRLYKEEREQLSKDVLYYKQSCKDLKRRLKTEVLLVSSVLETSSSSVFEMSSSSVLESLMSLHETQVAAYLKL